MGVHFHQLLGASKYLSKTNHFSQWKGIASINTARPFSNKFTRNLASQSPAKENDPRGSYARYKIYFKRPSGVVYSCTAAEGESILSLAQHAGLEIEGACQGECACSTCHVILSSKEHYLSLDPPTEKESDMLDLAYGLTETSRLGCQLRMKRDLSGVEITLPGITQDVQKDV